MGGADLGIVIDIDIDDDDNVIVRTYDQRTNRHYTISYCEEDITPY